MTQFRTFVIAAKGGVLLVGLIILLSIGNLHTAPTAWSQQSVEVESAPNPVGTVFSYQGRLLASNSPAEGNYDFRFTLYDAESAGNIVSGPVEKSNIAVKAGGFTVQIDFGAGAFTGAPRWLEIAVRKAGEVPFETLTARQPLTPVPYAIYADQVNLAVAQARVSGVCADGSSVRLINSDGTVACEADDIGQARVTGVCATGSSIREINDDGTVACEPDDVGGGGSNNHDHLGQMWAVNGNPLTLRGSSSGVNGAPLILENTGTGNGLLVRSAGALGNASIAINSSINNGVNAVVQNANAINALSNSSYATIYAENQDIGTTLYISNTATGAGLVAKVGNNNAVVGRNSSGFATVYGENGADGAGGWFTSWTGDILVAQEEVERGRFETRFRVALNGEVYADGSFNPGGADLAEMLPAVPGLEPGDVLVIGPDGRLTASSTPNASNVAGVYSTKPGFLAGLHNGPEIVAATGNQQGATLTPSVNQAGAFQPDNLPVRPTNRPVASMAAATKATQTDTLALVYAQQGRAPVAVIGVVPVKVTDENGPIQPGDLLTSATTPGHAMKAIPVNLSGIELYRPGTIIGKALEPWADGSGMIQVLIVLQ